LQKDDVSKMVAMNINYPEVKPHIACRRHASTTRNQTIDHWIRDPAARPRWRECRRRRARRRTAHHEPTTTTRPAVDNADSADRSIAVDFRPSSSNHHMVVSTPGRRKSISVFLSPPTLKGNSFSQNQ
jgi:hypothetical protein